MNESQDSLLRLVSKLYYIDWLGQSEIADIVGVSRSQISRMLRRAREREVVRITVEEYDPRNRNLENEIKDCFQMRHVFVIHTYKDSGAATVRHVLGIFGAPLISELLYSNMVVGVAGGRSMYELVRRLTPTSGTQGLTVVQLMGNVGPEVASNDAIELSRELAQRFQGSYFTLNAPVYVHDSLSRGLWLQHEHVTRVWKLFGIMNIALVGIGSLQDSLFIDRGMLPKDDIEKLVRENAVGEICGRFYGPDGQECNTDYRDRVISIGLDELRNTNDVIGVVANGASRVEAIYAAAKSGLVKSLLIDEAAAFAIMAKIEKAKLHGM